MLIGGPSFTVIFYSTIDTVMYLLVFFCLIYGLSAVPINQVQKAVDNDLEKQDNYLPKVGDFPKFHYASFGENTQGSDDDELLNVIDFQPSHKESLNNIVKVNHQEKPKRLGNIVDVVKDGPAAGMDIITDVGSMLKSTVKPETGTERQETTVAYDTTTDAEMATVTLEKKIQLDPVILEDNNNNTTNRTIRNEEQQELNDDDDAVEVNNTADNDKEKESQESEEEEEEEDTNMVTGLISAFLGGLSRPDGSVDVEAITGLLGSLSSQNEDGTYNFSGLTELLMSFFGGEGGSDFGAFLGGLAGASIQGVAKPPGAKGAGSFIGNLLGAALPGLSAPAPSEEGGEQKPQPTLDSGGFLGGLLSSLVGNVGSLSNSGSSGSSDNTGGGGNKFSLFKAIFSTITGIFSSSSSSTAH